MKQALFTPLLSERHDSRDPSGWAPTALAKLLPKEQGIPLLDELFKRIDVDDSKTLR